MSMKYANIATVDSQDDLLHIADSKYTSIVNLRRVAGLQYYASGSGYAVELYLSSKVVSFKVQTRGEVDYVVSAWTAVHE